MGENAIADLIDYLSANGPPDNMKESECQLILRALRLLAAAEANDGSTPGSDSSQVQVEVWANGERHTTSNAFIDATVARRLERERNALAARVRELEADAERIDWIEKNACVIKDGEPLPWKPFIRDQLDAARSK